MQPSYTSFLKKKEKKKKCSKKSVPHEYQLINSHKIANKIVVLYLVIELVGLFCEPELTLTNNKPMYFVLKKISVTN